MRRHASLLFFATAAVFAVSTAACGGAPSESTSTDDEDVTSTGPFAGAGYYQIDNAHPINGEITVISLSANKTFWGSRCSDAACSTTESISGTYKYSKTRLRFYDASGSLLGAWAYTLKNGTLSLREIGTHDLYALDPMSESLCDSSGGAWSDDDLGPHGLNCACPTNQEWGPSGCH